MQTTDLSLGMRLKQQAGWNQTEADWRRFLALQPDGCFVAESEGVEVATVTTCRFGDVAWIAMMLVNQESRGQGIGRSLMAHALEYLDRSGVLSVRLDATPLGEPLYKQLGFYGEYPLVRLVGEPESSESTIPPQSFDPALLDGLLDLDRSVTGTDRSRLLHYMAEESPENVRIAGGHGEVEGYLMSRPGSGAWQIGPCIARGKAGPNLLLDSLSRLRRRPVLVDIPTANTQAMNLAKAAGLVIKRHFLRMCRGEKFIDSPNEIWASSGPEMG